MNEQEEIEMAAEFQKREAKRLADAQVCRRLAVFMGAVEMTEEDCEGERIPYLPDIFKYQTPPGLDEVYTTWHIENMKYHKSWDWLMDVCRKVKKVSGDIGQTRTGVISARMLVSLVDLDIKKTIAECLAFIDFIEQPKILVVDIQRGGKTAKDGDKVYQIHSAVLDGKELVLGGAALREKGRKRAELLPSGKIKIL